MRYEGISGRRPSQAWIRPASAGHVIASAGGGIRPLKQCLNRLQCVASQMETAARTPADLARVPAQRQGGLRLTERFRFEWRPGTPIAAPAGRIEFRPVSGDGELLDLMTVTMDGTLDAHSQQDLALMSARQGAVRHFEGELACYSSARQWWQIATLPGGEPAGFVISARNNYHAIIAYLGVLPAHRGNGYINEILAEGTRILAAQDVPRIRASTDLGNVPMAEAFTRAGWVNFQRSISMTWP